MTPVVDRVLLQTDILKALLAAKASVRDGENNNALIHIAVAIDMLTQDYCDAGTTEV
jgi:hypothetical protein